MTNDFKALKWIYGESKKSLVALASLTITGVALAAVGVSFAIASKNVLDVATATVKGNIFHAALSLGGLIIVQLALQALFTAIDARARGSLEIRLRNRLFSGMLEADYSGITRHHSGELVNRLFGDISSVAGGVMQIVPNGLSFVTRTLLSFFVLLRLDPVLAVLCVLMGLLVAIASKIYRGKMKSLHKKTQETKGKAMAFMQECLQNLLMVKSFRGEDAIAGHATSLQQEHYKYSIKRNNISIMSNILFYIMVTMVYYFALSWEAYRLSKGAVTFGTLTAVLQLIGQVQTPFRGISAMFPVYFSMIASAERIMEILGLPCESDSEPVNCKEIYDNLDSIVFDNVSFAYGDTTVFMDASLKITKGGCIAFSAASGIGKSTLLKLLLGIIAPDKGRIFVLLKNGAKYNLDKSTRGLFAYVPQGNMVLSGTISDNISFSNKHYDKKSLIRCAKAAQLWEFVNSLPQGLDTVIGEKGLGLSEGQIQRLAIARALYHGSPIILLDEATSALDEETEAAVLRSISSMEGKTCVIVSHRKTVFEVCRQVIGIHDGKFNILSQTSEKI